ncbi:MAG TPA: putative Ig domain-containing protein [Nitrospiraceae bacterium]|nr:putative Ig domain-containing protein [Nitrospiraceae bacterium]
MTLTKGVSNLGYNHVVQGGGGSGVGYVWTVSIGALPPGVTLISGTPNATLRGIPTVTGTFNFTIRVQDSIGQSSTQDLVLQVTDAMVRAVAGTGNAGFSGDNDFATSAELNTPAGVAVDSAGNILISDQLNHRVRRIDGQTKLITTVVGTGVPGFNGDPNALLTEFNSPVGVGLDASGNWLLIDSGNHLLRRVRVDVQPMLVSTLAGTGIGGFKDGPVATAQLNGPAGMAVEASGTVLIADSVNNRVRRVNLQTGQVTTVAGTGTGGFNGDNILASSAQLNLPTGVAVDFSGNIFIADTLNQRIRRIDGLTNEITTVAGTGAFGFNGDNPNATLAQLSFPLGIAVDTAGNVLIADSLSHRVRLVNMQSGEIKTIIGTGAPSYNGDDQLATTAQINAPMGLTVSAIGEVFFTEASGMRVRRIGQ